MNLKEITKGGDYSFSEKIIQYMKIMSELMGKKLLVFVNIRSDLEKDQIHELMKNAVYNEIALLFIENIQRDFSKDKKYYIIDKDKCEVYWLPAWKPVLNADDGSSFLNLRFENDVKEYGFQTER